MTRTRTNQLARIADVVAVGYEAEQAKMRRLLRQEEELLARLDDLSPARARIEVGGGLDPASLTGADLRWQTWAEARRKEINLSLARLRVEQAQAKSDLAKAFGRSRAVEGLIRTERTRTQPTQPD